MKKVALLLVVVVMLSISVAISESTSLQNGDSGAAVQAIQKTLVALNYLSEEFITGEYDDLTEVAILAFQLDHSIDPTGIADSETQHAIADELRSMLGGGSSQNNTNQEALPVQDAPSVQDEEQSETDDNPNADYKLLKDYRWSLMGIYYYEGLVIKNTSGSTKDYDAQVMFYDNNNQLIGVGNYSADVVGNGQEALIKCQNESSFDHIEYTITSKDSRYNEVQSFIDIQVQTTNDKAIIIAKNTGNVVAEFVEYQCLFINQGQVVGSGWGYVDDSDSELKPGKTEFREESCYEPFETVELYFTGRYR